MDAPVEQFHFGIGGAGRRRDAAGGGDGGSGAGRGRGQGRGEERRGEERSGKERRGEENLALATPTWDAIRLVGTLSTVIPEQVHRADLEDFEAHELGRS